MAKMSAISTTPKHMIAEPLTDRFNLRKIIPPAMIPIMADGMLTPPEGKT